MFNKYSYQFYLYFWLYFITVIIIIILTFFNLEMTCALPFVCTSYAFPLVFILPERKQIHLS